MDASLLASMVAAMEVLPINVNAALETHYLLLAGLHASAHLRLLGRSAPRLALAASRPGRYWTWPLGHLLVHADR